MTDTRSAPRSVVDVLGLASAYLDTRRFATPRLDAELLLGHVLGLRRLELYLHHDRPLEATELDRFRDLLRRRGRGEPVAYLVGSCGFRGLVLACDARALIPRPETEILVELALAVLPDRGRLLDVGTGSGAVALAVAAERPDADVTASDISDAALSLAAVNAGTLSLPVAFVASDLLAAFGDDQFDVITANLPYIPDHDPLLQDAVRDHEPHTALFGGADGLALISRAVADAPRRLRVGGTLLLEVGHDQAGRVVTLARDAGFATVTTHRDLTGIDRFVVAGGWQRSYHNDDRSG
jgi:release factor glutamine methyltransferase